MPRIRRTLDTLALAVVVVTAAGCSLLRAPAPAPRHAIPRIPAAVDPATDTIAVTWIGHATVLVRIRDRWILTDPVLGERIARIYPRSVAAGIDPDDLPPIDAVLISHAHMDHLDPASLRRVTKPGQAGEVGVIATPPGAARFIPDDLGAPVVVLDTWEQWRGDRLTITAVPASHGAGRYGVDRWVRRSHTGWIVEVDGLSVYFAGDTGCVPVIAAAIARRFAIDVALIPVGPAGRSRIVEWLRARVHATPEEALALFDAVGAQWMVPIHFGTFFGPPDREPPIVRRAVAAHPRGDRVRVLGIGDTAEFLY